MYPYTHLPAEPVIILAWRTSDYSRGVWLIPHPHHSLTHSLLSSVWIDHSENSSRPTDWYYFATNQGTPCLSSPFPSSIIQINNNQVEDSVVDSAQWVATTPNSSTSISRRHTTESDATNWSPRPNQTLFLEYSDVATVNRVNQSTQYN